MMVNLTKREAEALLAALEYAVSDEDLEASDSAYDKIDKALMKSRSASPRSHV